MKPKSVLLPILLLALLYVALGAVLPHLHHPDISPETAQRTADTVYTADSPGGEQVKILSDNGEALAHRIRLISQAQDRIILSTFEFRPDEAGMQVLAALHAAAERGVRVQLLVDGVSGLMNLTPTPAFRALSALPTAEVRIYNPIRPWLPWTLMGRLHDKYLIVDETAYLLGGRNTFSYFLGDQPGHKNYDWDALVYCKSGTDSLRQVRDYFEAIWDGGDCHVFQDDPDLLSKQKYQKAADKLRALYARMQADHPDWFAPWDYEGNTLPARKITLLSNPIHTGTKEPVVFYQLMELLSRSEESVTLHTPYIISNRFMRSTLAAVCQKVPEVRLLTNSVANNGNPFGSMDYWVNKGSILDTGVSILEFDSGISYHGKCARMDDRLSVLGSFNLDMRSTYLDTELMLVIDSPEVNASMAQEMGRYEAEALRVIDRDTTQAPEGRTPQTIPLSKYVTMTFILLLGGWARFLL